MEALIWVRSEAAYLKRARVLVAERAPRAEARLKRYRRQLGAHELIAANMTHMRELTNVLLASLRASTVG